MFVLILVIYIAGLPPAISVEMHDFAKEEKCNEAGALVQALARTELNSGAKVAWRCLNKEESTVRTRIGEGAVPTQHQHFREE